MKLWLNQLTEAVPSSLKTPEEAARFELESALPGVKVDLERQDDLGEGFRLETRADGSVLLSGGAAGLLYGAYRLILDRLCGEAPASLSSSPRYALRMLNCWDNADGSVERGYSGNSLFFQDGRLSWDPGRIRELARLLASCGINTLCVNNVNVHFPAQLLLEDMLPDLAALADAFRPFGVRLMVSVDFSQPMRSGIPTADPLDARVRAWWAECALYSISSPTVSQGNSRTSRLVGLRRGSDPVGQRPSPPAEAPQGHAGTCRPWGSVLPTGAVTSGTALLSASSFVVQPLSAQRHVSFMRAAKRAVMWPRWPRSARGPPPS